MPELVELSHKYQDQPFVLLAVSDEPASLVEGSVKELNMTYPVAAGFKAERNFTIGGYPSAALIDHEGKVLFQGLPWDMPAGLLDQAIAAALADQPWEAKQRHASLEKAENLGREGKISSAWKAAESARKKNAEDAAAIVAIDEFQQDILNRGATRLAKAEKIAESGRYFVATEFLNEQIAIYKGTPLEKQWKAVPKEWLQDKQAKLQFDLDKKRLSALGSAYKGDPEKAFKALKKLKEKAEGLAILDVISQDYEGIRAM